MQEINDTGLERKRRRITALLALEPNGMDLSKMAFIMGETRSTLGAALSALCRKGDVVGGCPSDRRNKGKVYHLRRYG